MIKTLQQEIHDLIHCRRSGLKQRQLPSQTDAMRIPPTIAPIRRIIPTNTSRARMHRPPND